MVIGIQEKLAAFLEALDEWDCDYVQMAEAIIDFQKCGYDLDAYAEEFQPIPKSELN